MSDHAKFYAGIDAKPGEWLAVDRCGSIFRYDKNPGDPLNIEFPCFGLPFFCGYAFKPSKEFVSRNGVDLHWKGSLWQVPQPLTNEQRLVIYCAARDVQRGKAMRHRGEHKRLQALADYALVFGTPEQHRSMCDKAERHRIAADRFGAKADQWNRKACVIRKRIK